MLDSHASLGQPREVRLDHPDGRHAMHERRGPHQVRLLHQFEPAVFQFQARRVERTTVMGDQDDAVQAMDIGQKLEFVNNALLFQMGLRMSGQAGPPGSATRSYRGRPRPFCGKSSKCSPIRASEQ